VAIADTAEVARLLEGDTWALKFSGGRVEGAAAFAPPCFWLLATQKMNRGRSITPMQKHTLDSVANPRLVCCAAGGAPANSHNITDDGI
jgi:hypothetical protein